MADDQKVTLELELESGQFVSKLNGVQSQIMSFASHGESSFTSFGAKVIEITALFELFNKGVELVSKGIEKMSEAITVASGKDQLVHNLNNALASSGLYSHEASEALVEYAEQIERTTAFSSEAVISAERLAANYSTSEEQIRKLTTAALDLASATGTDVDTAVRKLALSMEGVSYGLNRIIPGIKNLTEEQIKAGGAVDLVIQKFGGQAQTSLMTYEGHIKNLHSAHENFLESIGKIVTQSPTVLHILEMMSQHYRDMSEAMKGITFEGILEKIEPFVSFATGVLIPTVEMIYNAFKYLFDLVTLVVDQVIAGLTEFSSDLVQFFLNPLIQMFDVAAKAAGVFSSDMQSKLLEASSFAKSIVETMATATKSTADVLSDADKKATDSLNHMFDFPFSDKIKNMSDSIFQFARDSHDALTEYSNDTKKMANETTTNTVSVSKAFWLMDLGVIEAAQEMTDSTEDSFVDMGKTMMRTMATGAATAFEAFGKALAQGKDGLKAFADAVLSSLGQMAVQLGTKFILEGTAYLFIPGWEGFGPPLIAAGAALATFGGVLSGISGGGGSSPGGSPSGAYAGAETPSPTNTTPAPATEKQMQTKQAQIIINGDFLNSRETANHLAAVLRENSDITDYTITAQGRSYA